MTTTGEFGEMVPQDVAAIFHVSFHTTQGYRIDWSMKDRESMDIAGVEYSCLPSGVHSVEQDVIYFTKGEHQGVCVFRRRATTEEGQRGFRISSLGILLARSPRPRPWRHVPALKELADAIYTSLEGSGVLQPSGSDWDPARAFFQARRARQPDLGGAGDWGGWFAELDGDSLSTFETSPTLHLSHLLRILGPSALTVYKHVLGRRRVLIYTAPPVEAACIFCHVAADTCYEDQIGPTSHGNPDSTNGSSLSVSASIQQGPYQSLGKNPKGGIKVLGVITLNDLERLERESQTGYGWVACTTEKLYLSKPSLYDLVLDLTMETTPGKMPRPVMYAPKLAEQFGRPSYNLAPVSFTWSDTQLWADINRIISMDSVNPDLHHHRPIILKSKLRDQVRLGVLSKDGDRCVLCSSLFMNSWQGIHELDDTHTRKSEIEVKEGTGVGSKTKARHHQSARGLRFDKGSAETLNYKKIGHADARYTDAAADADNSPPLEGNVQGGAVMVSLNVAGLRERRLMMTLSILHAFRKNTVALIHQLTSLLFPIPPASSLSHVVLTPKDVSALKLAPLSPLDQRFVEWLAQEHGDGVQLAFRRGLFDLCGAALLLVRSFNTVWLIPT